MLTDEQISHLAAELDVLDPHDPVWGEFARLVLIEAAPEIRRVERERLSAPVLHLLSAHVACGVYCLTSLKEGERHYVEMWLQTQEQHDKWQTALAAVQEAFGVSDESISDSADALKSGPVN